MGKPADDVETGTTCPKEDCPKEDAVCPAKDCPENTDSEEPGTTCPTKTTDGDPA